MKISSEKILGIVATTISIATLVVLVYQSRLMRIHEERSALPKIELWNNPRGGQYSLNLFNNGLGPAIIEKVEIIYNGEIYDMDLFQFALSVTDTLQIDSLQVQGESLYPGMIIPPGARNQLIWTNRLGSVLNPIISLVYEQHAVVRIRYSSVYGTVWRLDGFGSLPVVDRDYNPAVAKRLLGED